MEAESDPAFEGRCAGADGGMAAVQGLWASYRACFAASEDAPDWPTAVSCHNCYHEDPGAEPDDNLERTLLRIHAALADGYDIIELDVKDEAGVWRVDHEDDGTAHAAELSDVLADAPLCDAAQVLFVEVKESEPTPDKLRRLLEHLRDSRCIRPGRRLSLRAFRGRREALVQAKAILREPAFAGLARETTVHVLYSARSLNDGEYEEDASSEALSEIDAVEFEHTAEAVHALLVDARDAGFGTGVWTFPLPTTEALCHAFRGEVDIMTVDGPVDACRRAIETGD